MKSYTSCFLGIPLPQEFMNKFKQLLHEIHVIDPFIETVEPRTPHITIYYLNQQSQYSLEEITKLVQLFAKNLRGSSLKVGEFNYFTQVNPKVLFLDVIYPESLTNFKNKISESLEEYSALDNTLPFYPHMTVGRIKDTQAQESFRKSKKKLALRLNEIHWDFTINEIALYGVDSAKSPEYQEKLITIPVG